MANEWNGTWPDGTRIVPAAGTLVAYEDGWWGVINKRTNAGLFIGDHPLSELIQPGDSKTGFLARLSPLAPPPAAGKLWDALEVMREVVTADAYYGYQNWEAGRLCMARLNSAPEIEYHTYVVNTCMAKVLPKHYAAHMRDMQRYGALLAYCAQPGWEATE